MKRVLLIIPILGLFIACSGVSDPNEKEAERIEKSTEKLEEVIQTSEQEIDKAQKEIDELLEGI